MVLKKSKFNANTGNTLRRVCGCSWKGIARSIKTDAYITKNEWNYKKWHKKDSSHQCISYGDVLDKPILDLSDGVKYSLNKRNRWLVPDQIKQKLSHRNVESHLYEEKLKKRRKNKKPSSSNRCNITLIDTDRHCRTRRGDTPKTWTLSLQMPEHRKAGPDRTYTVEKKVDSVGFYHTDVNVEDYNKWYRNVKRKKNVDNQKPRRSRGRTKDYYRDHIEDNIYSTDDEEDSYTMNDNCFITECKIDQKVQLHHTKNNPNPSSVVELDTNDHTVNELATEPVNVKMIGLKHAGDAFNNYYDILREINLHSDKDIKMVNYTIQYFVDSRKIEKEYLFEHFGNYFMEGNCSPRRFCIFDKNFAQTGVFLTVCVLRENNGQPEVLIRIFNIAESIAKYLGTQAKDGVLPFDFLLDLCFNLDAITSYYVTHVFNLPSSSYTNSPHWSNHYYTSNKLQGESCEIIRMEDVWFGMIKGRNNLENSKAISLEKQCCSLCFLNTNLTYLVPCGHYLCDACWEKYIDAKVSSGCFKVICPDPECKEQIEPLVILTYLSENLAMLFIRKRCEIEAQQISTMKICPTDNCANFALCRSADTIENTLSNPCVPCGCKSTWCFNCLDQDHWPASCEANKEYWEQNLDLSLYDDEGNLVSNHAIVKKCPYCNYPIEKDGGCDHMICKCGGSFCWRCRTKIKEEAQIHHCKWQGSIKVLFDNPSLINSLSRTNIGWTKKADSYKEYINRLKRVLEKAKMRPLVTEDQEEESSTSDASINTDKSQSNTREKEILYWCRIRISITLLIQCYKILQNICIETAFRDSKHSSLRTRLYIAKLTPVLDKLFRPLVDEHNLSEFEKITHYASAAKNMEAIKSCLNEVITYCTT